MHLNAFRREAPRRINNAGADGNDDAVSRLGGAGHSYDESWTPPVIADTKARRKRFRKGSSYLLLFRKHRTPQVSFRLRGRGMGPESWESGVSHGKKMRQGNRSSLPSMVVPSGNGHSFPSNDFTPIHQLL